MYRYEDEATGGTFMLGLLAVTERPDFDPSLTSPTAPFTATFNDYVRRDLGYETDTEYETLSLTVNEKWKDESAGREDSHDKR